MKPTTRKATARKKAPAARSKHTSTARSRATAKRGARATARAARAATRATRKRAKPPAEPCTHPTGRVLETRRVPYTVSGQLNQVRRRLECKTCGHRWTEFTSQGTNQRRPNLGRQPWAA